MGHSRRFGGLCRMSAVPPLATEERTSIYVGKGPIVLKKSSVARCKGG